MKVLRIQGFSLNRKRRKGSMVILLVVAVGTAAFFTATKFSEDSLVEYRISIQEADGFKANSLAKAGFLGGIGALKKIPEEVLYQSGIAFDPPPIPLGGGVIYYSMIPEDGKINMNGLVKLYDDQPNQRMIEIVTRLYTQFGIKRELIYPVIDWIDTNTQEMGGGAEYYYYSRLKPPRKIKNAPFYSMSELLSVKGYDRKMVYETLKMEDYDKNNSDSFKTDEEKALISDKDFVLSNNITAYLPFGDTYDDRININAAPYHVLMSMSDFMTKAAVMKILKLKLKKNGYIKELKDLENEPEFQAKSAGNLTLYKELAGEGTDVSGGRIKTKGEIYKVIGVGIIKDKVVRRVTGIFDLPNDTMLYYTED
ncbi:general secretion pathway protein GspK [Leptospira sp. GIMC2001]|uniref:general secretion pathway protein GspK n=1 Tax=Leptospira sp. GIMC2001 TaxID=1513297 RepID=UPI00234AE149|nr:type II secretion system protein GspK [Leptospira sp. GIMC2001]WCL47940.1 type II secretion system protein GspK [Leptospira sp. GIMC2001]